MAETFYTALGVDSTADAAEIRDAYRDCVKERHPDVSDDPGAPREFRRLTTARDVLIDDAERARYDRLGHATYVTRHLKTSAWAGETTESGADAHGGNPAGGTTGESRNQGETGPGDDRSTWLGDDWDGPSESRARRQAKRRERAQRRAGQRESAGAAASANWQHASEAYRYQPSSVPTDPSTARETVRQFLGSIGPWVVVHLLFVATTIATAWFVYTSTGMVGLSALPAMAFGALLVGLALFLSAMHLLSLAVG